MAAAFILKNTALNTDSYLFFIKGLVWFYVLFFIISNIKSKYLEYPKAFKFLKQYLLAVTAFFVFYENSVLFVKMPEIVFIIFLSAVLIWIVFLIIFNKKINFNLNAVSFCLEIILIMSLIVFGIKSQITFYILSAAAFDFLYTLCLFAAANHFNKKHLY